MKLGKTFVTHGRRADVKTANDSSSETAEGGGAWRAGCGKAAGGEGGGSSQRDTRHRPEQFSAAPLFGAFRIRLVADVDSVKRWKLESEERAMIASLFLFW